MSDPNSQINCVVLVGPMGAGKSAVGRRLARLLDFRFCDSDTEIERRTGVDIGFIFEKEGEDGFRRRESEVLAELAGVPGTVLATGGGAVLDPVNRRLLAGSGTVIYLHATVEQQLERTRHARTRPLLDNDNPRSVLDALFSVRDPLYREIADYRAETDGRKVFDVAREVADWLRNRADRTPAGETNDEPL